MIRADVGLFASRDARTEDPAQIIGNHVVYDAFTSSWLNRLEGVIPRARAAVDDVRAGFI